MRDSEIFRKHILEFPKQLKPDNIRTANLDKLQKQIHAKKPDSIVFIGMGGSGTPGAILQNILSCAIVNIPIFSWHDSVLPVVPGKNPLYIFISFSGNTREPLAAFQKAVKSGKMIAVVAGGGTLLEEAKAKQLPHATFSADSGSYVDISPTPRQQPVSPSTRSDDTIVPAAAQRDGSDKVIGETRPVPSGSASSAHLRRYASEMKSESSISSAGLASGTDEARTRDVENINIGSLQPRQAYGLTLYATLQILQSVFPRLHIPDLSAQINSRRFATSAKKTAARIFGLRQSSARQAGKIALIYTTHNFSHLGQIFKISITESGKSLAFANTIPEVNHNELNLLEARPKNLYAIFITSEQEYKNRKKEFDLTAQTLDEYGIPSETIRVPGRTPLEVTANGIVIAQWIGYYVAVNRKMNPLGLEVVNKIKKLAGKKKL